MYWFETLLDDFKYYGGKLINIISSFFGGREFWKILGFLATIASAVAAVFSYFAAARSAEVANKAQTFVEQSAAIQDKLASPRISITGGKLTYLGAVIPENSYDTQKYRFRIQFTLRNSGDRDASPIWVAFSSYIFSSPEARQFVLPKGAELSLEEEIEIAHDWTYRDQNVVVVLGYEDRMPNRISKVQNMDFLTTCDGPTVFKLSPSEYAMRAFKRSYSTRTEKLPAELFLPPAQALSLSNTDNLMFFEGREALQKIKTLMGHCLNPQQ